MNIENIAKVCHEANRSYCEAIGDNSQKLWHDAQPWQKDSAIEGVTFCLNNPDAPASANHESWLENKKAAGWTYGKYKDEQKKKHPCIVPYDELPLEQRLKDVLFKAVVASLSLRDGTVEIKD